MPRVPHPTRHTYIPYPTYMVHKSMKDNYNGKVCIPRTLYHRFKKIYPMYGAFTSVVTQLILDHITAKEIELQEMNNDRNS